MGPGARAGFAWALALAGCAADPGRPASPATPPAGSADGNAARIEALAADEARALDALAASDPRLARRAGRTPSGDEADAAKMRGLLAEGADAVLHEGSIDLFAFAARARGVDEAARVVGRSPGPSSDSAPAGSRIARPRLERELLERLVAEERARVDEERELPRGASALVRGVVATWEPATTDDARTERDEWLGRRLDLVRGSLAQGLDRTALLELDDALDPLERLSEGLPESSRALAALRIAIDGTKTPPPDEAGWARVAAGLKTHLGVTLAPVELRARLDRAEKALRADAVARLARAGTDEKAVARLAEELLFTGGACGAAPASSRVRAMGPPPERAAICGVLQALRERSDAARAAAVVALHDETVVAQWAMAIHEEHQRPERATQAAHPFFGAAVDREARMLRVAAARPVTAIGAGLAAELLTRDPDGAERWFAFGDAPLDVVEREVFAGAGPR